MGNNRNRYLDDSKTTINRRDIVIKKKFLRRIYDEWYHLVKSWLPQKTEKILELGSGPGFIKEIIPSVYTSDILYLPFVDLSLNALNLPFDYESIDAVTMIDVFHHIPEAERLFAELSRILKSGGRLIMIEPWMTRWSMWFYRVFHHELLDKETPDWQFPSSGPLSGANQALPWIVFNRDRQRFEEMYEDLRIVKIQPFMPVAYLLSGGFSNKISMPGFAYDFCRRIEKKYFNRQKRSMFCLIVLEKN